MIFIPKIWQKVRMIETNKFEINCDELFKYQDSTYGGVAYYDIFYHHEYIVE